MPIKWKYIISSYKSTLIICVYVLSIICVYVLLNLLNVILLHFISLIHTLCWYIDHYHCQSLSSAVIRPRQIPQQGVQALNNINNNIEVENTASPVHSNRSSPSRVEGKPEACYSATYLISKIYSMLLYRDFFNFKDLPHVTQGFFFISKICSMLLMGLACFKIFTACFSDSWGLINLREFFIWSTLLVIGSACVLLHFWLNILINAFPWSKVCQFVLVQILFIMT